MIGWGITERAAKNERISYVHDRFLEACFFTADVSGRVTSYIF
jgi:hypothetical protein